MADSFLGDEPDLFPLFGCQVVGGEELVRGVFWFQHLGKAPAKLHTHELHAVLFLPCLQKLRDN
jgi:hypothetical protein